MSYPLEQLLKEVAFIAYYFHWSQDEILTMEHKDRRQWVNQISAINNNLSGIE